MTSSSAGAKYRVEEPSGAPAPQGEEASPTGMTLAGAANLHAITSGGGEGRPRIDTTGSCSSEQSWTSDKKPGSQSPDNQTSFSATSSTQDPSFNQKDDRAEAGSFHSGSDTPRALERKPSANGGVFRRSMGLGIGDFAVMGKLGEGGYGTVLLARHKTTGMMPPQRADELPSGPRLAAPHRPRAI